MLGGFGWLLRMARWARHPPSARMVWLVVGVVLGAALLVGIERFVGWPDALTTTGGGRPLVPGMVRP